MSLFESEGINLNREAEIIMLNLASLTTFFTSAYYIGLNKKILLIIDEYDKLIFNQKINLPEVIKLLRKPDMMLAFSGS